MIVFISAATRLTLTPLPKAAEYTLTVDGPSILLDGDRVRLLLAGFHTDGADGFSAGLFSAERRELSPTGRALRGTVTIRIRS